MKKLSKTFINLWIFHNTQWHNLSYSLYSNEYNSRNGLGRNQSVINYFIKSSQENPKVFSLSYVKEDLSLSEHYYTCTNCGELIGRDMNAAKNILAEGLRNISAGTVDYNTDREGVRLACKHSLMESESHKSLACG